MRNKSRNPALAHSDRGNVWRPRDTMTSRYRWRLQVNVFTVLALALMLGAVSVGCAGGGSRTLPPAGMTTQNGSTGRSLHSDPTPLPSPTWWAGNCDVGHNSGSYPLGGAVQGVPACGPGPNMGGSDYEVHFYSGAWGEFEWECVELSMRYMYLAYHIAPYPANGWNIADNYTGSLLVKVANNGLGPLPAPGDILSYGNGSAAQHGGHTAVVSSVTFDALGRESSITVVEQNNSAGGVSTLTVIAGIVTGGPYHVRNWLHYPGGPVPTPTPSPTPTPTPTPVITEFSIPTGGSNPIGIASGPDGALWFAESNASKIGRMPTSGTGTSEYPIPTSGSSPYFIAAGSDGALWFTEYGGNKIGRIPTNASPGSGAQITEYAIPTSYSEPMGITKGPDGAMWFVEYYGNKVGRIATDDTVTEFPIPTAASNPYGIAAGSDGALWFTEAAGNQIGRIPANATPGSSAQIQEFPIPSGGKAPYGITAGSDGALWYTMVASSMLGRITTTGTSSMYYVYTSQSYPYAITSGADGALWFTEQNGNKIGRSATDGTISETAIPTSGSYPNGITSGPDGAIWFAEGSANKIGRIK
ncbi:MAG: CHAP domain-containing protein [Candidatus Eremiobacteraeota bacterium]|nr:CHAP domain-containing protein [Candidatus Eremiobacteraeota bacterium]